jgi:hypothetical protein
MYIQRNTEARSGNQCCRGKTVSIMYSDCVPVTFFIQHANAHSPYYTVICGL